MEVLLKFGNQWQSSDIKRVSTLAVFRVGLGVQRLIESLLQDSQVEDGLPLLQAVLIFGQGAKGSRWLMAH